MQFYKILRQRELKEEPFLNLLEMKDFDYIKGKLFEFICYKI